MDDLLLSKSLNKQELTYIKKERERVKEETNNIHQELNGSVIVKREHLKMFSKNMSDILMAVEVIRRAVDSGVNLVDERNEFDQVLMKINHLGADVSQTIDEFYLK